MKSGAYGLGINVDRESYQCGAALDLSGACAFCYIEREVSFPLRNLAKKIRPKTLSKK